MNKIVKSLSVIAFVGAVALTMTGAFFSSSGVSTGNTFSSGTLTLLLSNSFSGTYTSSVASTWDYAAMVPGGTPQEDTLWLQNSGSIGGKSLGLALATTETISGFEKQVRITKLTLDGQNLLQGGAGASIPDYVAPIGCTVTVSGTTITAAISAATAGNTICVTPGDYNTTWEGVSQIALSKGVTVVSTEGPAVTSTIPFNITSSDATVRGFNITNPDGTYGVQIASGISNVNVKDNNINHIGNTPTTGSAQAIYLTAGASGGAHFVFSGNTISNIGNLNLIAGSGTSAKGIYIGDSNGTGIINDVLIQNNIISNVQASSLTYPVGRGGYGVLVNVGSSTGNASGKVTGLVIKNNTISNLSGFWETAIGLEGTTPGASVTFNDLYDLGSVSAGVMVEDNSSAGSVLINNNNFALSMALGIINKTGIAVNGTGNWWGDFTPANHVFGSVNYSGFASGPIAGLLNGTDQNGNNYADLQDLRVSSFAGPSGFGLNAGQIKALVMGVQLDGATGNTYQNGSMTSAMTVTLQQQ